MATDIQTPDMMLHARRVPPILADRNAPLISRWRAPLRSTRLPVASWLGLVVALVLILAAMIVVSLSPGAPESVAQADPVAVIPVAPAEVGQ